MLQAKVSWLNYNSKHAPGVIKAAPKFYDVPEKWPIRKTVTPVPRYSRNIEMTLSLAVLGYVKENRVRNDKFYYTRTHATDGIRHMEHIEEAFVMKNDPFLMEMLVSLVEKPTDEN